MELCLVFDLRFLLLGQLGRDDVAVVKKLDRPLCSLKDAGSIQSGQARYRCWGKSIGTTLSSGRMMMHLVGFFAKFERC